MGFFFLILSFIFSSCVHEAKTKFKPKAMHEIGVRKLICPEQDFLSSGITRVKPKSAEQLVRQSVLPPAFSERTQWNINAVVAKNEDLYLSCFYGTRKILTYKLPLDRELCMAKDTFGKTFVECVKK